MKKYNVVNKVLISKVGSTELFITSFHGGGISVLEMRTPMMKKYSVPKRWLFGKSKDVDIAVLESVKYLPITSQVLFLIQTALSMPVREVSVVDDGVSETFYNTLNALDEADVKGVFGDYYKSALAGDDSSDWEYMLKPKNDIVNGYLKDSSYLYLGVKHDSSLQRFYWMFRTTMRGDLQIIIVRDSGVYEVGKTATVSVDSYLLDRNTMKTIMDFYTEKGE